MIYAELLGGVGNLMHIISTAYALALDNNDEAIFSQTLQSITHRRNEKWWFNTIFRNIKRSSHKPKYIYKEPKFTYSKIPYHPDMKIHGYFQSAQYFNHRRTEILQLLTDYKQDILLSLQLKLNLLPGKKISLHVRRGDYIKLQHTHHVLSIKYYQTAVKIMKDNLGSEYKDYIYLVFSDDITWCKKQNFLKNLPDVHFIEDSDAITKGPVEVFQLYLMSMCEHNIIANSSFSWWGSYLNLNPNKIVVCPKTWFAKGGPPDWSTIYCKNWIRC